MVQRRTVSNTVSLAFFRRNPAAFGFFLAVVFLSLVLAAPFFAADQKSKNTPQKGQGTQLSKAFKGRLPIAELTEDEAISHALNRLAFGPRPGDAEKIRSLGLEKWIEQQLKPETIDDSATDARLKEFPTLAMSTSDLLNKFPNPAIEAARLGLTPEQYRQRQQEQVRQQAQERRRQGQPEESIVPGTRQRLGQPTERQAMRMEMLEETNSPRRIIGELSAAKLTRAIYSERQLQELMADFWFNHFNVFAQKGPVLWMLPEYERQAIRPNAMGKFQELLYATAKSPAMLFYLDNWQSADPKAAEKLQVELEQRRQRLLSRFGGQDPRTMNDPRLRQRGRLGQQRQPVPGQPNAPPQSRMPRGLNENYARELMELHTLGVEGGYTQDDVIQVARAFTGWTLRAPRREAEFQFEPRIHDASPKLVLGKRIDAGGMKDGEEILALLAAHPNTAKFISTKIARRFVSDTPPAAIVDRMSRSFAESRGDIRSVLRTMIYSPEFWSREAYRSKIKKPFELVVSAARALGADVGLPFGMVVWTGRIGEPLYLCQPPTGYSDKAETWVNTGALLNRLNFTMELAANRMRGSRVNLIKLLGENSMSDPQSALDRAIQMFLAGQASTQTRATLEKQLSEPEVVRARLDDPVRSVDAGIVAGLVLGSPEFQRR